MQTSPAKFHFDIDSNPKSQKAGANHRLVDKDRSGAVDWAGFCERWCGGRASLSIQHTVRVDKPGGETLGSLLDLVGPNIFVRKYSLV